MIFPSVQSSNLPFQKYSAARRGAVQKDITWCGSNRQLHGFDGFGLFLESNSTSD